MVYFCLQVNIDTYKCICCHSIIGANKIGQATAAPATEADKACEYGESNASLALLAASMSCLLAKRLMVRVCNAPSDWKTNNAMSKRHVKDVIGAILCYYSLQRSFNAMHYSYTNCHSSRTRKNLKEKNRETCDLFLKMMEYMYVPRFTYICNCIRFLILSSCFKILVQKNWLFDTFFKIIIISCYNLKFALKN